MKKRLAFIALLFSFFTTASAQYVTSGKVIDKYGNPISGAKVMGKGTSRFVTTGMDGSYSLETSIPIKKVVVNSLGKQTKTQSIQKKDPYTIVTLKDYSIWNDHPDKYHWFVGLQTNVGLKKCFPIGVMGGCVKRFGFYVRGVFSSAPSTKGSIGRYPYYLSNFAFIDAKTSYMSLSAGGVMQVVGPLHIYLGAGYAKRKVTLKHANGDFHEYRPYSSDGGFFNTNFEDFCSYETLCIDGGLMFNIKHLMVNVGTTVGGSISCQLGIGYKF